MTILIENEAGCTFAFDHQETAEQVIETVLELEECPYEVQINLVLTGNSQIHQINLEFRGIDRETDVLSFPMVGFTKPADYVILEDSGEPYFNPDSGELMLGDIMISIEKAREQAASYGHALLREYAFLIAHSVLHLLGYDHQSESEAQDMELKQEKVLQKLNITR